MQYKYTIVRHTLNLKKRFIKNVAIRTVLINTPPAVFHVKKTIHSGHINSKCQTDVSLINKRNPAAQE